jgi:hypothetical protein
VVSIHVSDHKVPKLFHEGRACRCRFQVGGHEESITLAFGNAGAATHAVGYHDVSVATLVIITLEGAIEGRGIGCAGSRGGDSIAIGKSGRSRKKSKEPKNQGF